VAYDLKLPKALAKAGWKVKIRDKERLEEPHVTIIKGTLSWRVGLRNRDFLDEGRWKDFPDTLRESIETDWTLLCQEWDALYPAKPVPVEEETNDDEDD